MNTQGMIHSNNRQQSPRSATMTKQARVRAIIVSAVATAALITSVPLSRATTSTATWTNASGDNNWFTASNWSFTVTPNPAVAPNNGSGGISDYNVLIGAPAPTDLSDSGVTLDALTINLGGVLSISSAGPAISIASVGVFSNSGTVNVTGSVQLQTAALQGDGTISLNSGSTLILTLPPNTSLSTPITSSNTISGTGTIDINAFSSSFTNTGTIDANVAGAALSVNDSSFPGITNQGVMGATNNGTLNLSNTSLNQTATGLVYADGGNVNLGGIGGGTIRTDNGGSVSAGSLGGSTANPLTIDTNSAVNVSDQGAGLSGQGAGLSGNLINNGTLNLEKTISQLYLGANTDIAGTGSLVLNGGNTQLEEPNGRFTFTLGTQQTLSGYGALQQAYNAPTNGFTNDGTVNADVAGKSLAIDQSPSSAIVNNGTMEATSGILQVMSVTRSTSGVLDANGNNVQVINVSGGTLESAPGNAVDLGSQSGSTSYLTTGQISGTATNPLTISGGSTVVVAASGAGGNAVGMSGEIVNNGTIQLEGAGSNNLNTVGLSLTGSTDISGTGTIILSNNGGITLPQISAPGDYTLTVGSHQTISGDGFLGIRYGFQDYSNTNIVNNGTIDANSATGGLSLSWLSNVPSPTGGAPTVQPFSLTNNNLLEATDSGSLYLAAPAINQSSTGVIDANGGTVSIGSNAELVGEFAAAGPTISGGTLQSGSGGEIQSMNSFVLSGSTATPTTITAGTIVDAPLAAISEEGSFVASTSIQISGTVANNGTIRIGDDPSGGMFPTNFPTDYPSCELLLRPDSTLSGTGSIVIEPSPYQIYNQQHPSSTPFPPSQLHESELATAAAEFGTGTSVVNNALTNGGIVLANGKGGTLELRADNTNNGTYEAENGGTLQVDSGTLSNYSSGTLTGGAYDAAGGGDLNLVDASITTNAADVTLDGATSGFAAIAPITRNTGSFTLTNGAAFTTAGNFSNSGTLAVLNGTGLTISGKLTNTGSILLDPSTITVNGDLNLQSTSTLTIGLAVNTSGQYDQVSILGSAVLAGTLSVNILPGFTPTLGEAFTILTASNGITGSFNQSSVISGQDVFQIQYNNGAVQLDTTAVPEPAALALFSMAGAGVLLLRRRSNWALLRLASAACSFHERYTLAIHQKMCFPKLVKMNEGYCHE